MRYKSNLEAPDLSMHFKLLDPPMQIMGHDAPSDPDFEPGCTFWTHDEAAILYNIARGIKGIWVDVGARFGWTGAFLTAAGCKVTYVDPHLEVPERSQRLLMNIGPLNGYCDIIPMPFGAASDGNFIDKGLIKGFVIDGCHDAPEPLMDAITAYAHSDDENSIIVFHDYWGAPIQDAVDWLQSVGYKMRLYCTPNGVALCWKGCPDFKPPVHIADPAIDWKALCSARIK